MTRGATAQPAGLFCASKRDRYRTFHGRYSNPSVTTISADKGMIAETAVERLLNRIGSTAPVPGLEIRAPHRLVSRESTVGRRAGLPGDGNPGGR